MDDEQDRLAQIEQWFGDQGFDLFFDEAPGGRGWLALVTARETRIGNGVMADGATKLDAAEAVLQWAKDGDVPGVIVADSVGNVTIHPPTATGTAESPLDHVLHIADEVTVTDEIPVDTQREELADKLATFGWRIQFAEKPGGGYLIFVLDADTHEPIQTAEAEDWDDARLESIMRLLPPSREARQARRDDPMR